MIIDTATASVPPEGSLELPVREVGCTTRDAYEMDRQRVNVPP